MDIEKLGLLYHLKRERERERRRLMKGCFLKKLSILLQTDWPLIWLLLSDLPNKTPSLGLLLSVASVKKVF